MYHSSIFGAEFRQATKTDATEVPLENRKTVSAAIIPPKSATKLPVNSVCLLKTNRSSYIQKPTSYLIKVHNDHLYQPRSLHSLQPTYQHLELNYISSTKHLGVAVINVETLSYLCTYTSCIGFNNRRMLISYSLDKHQTFNLVTKAEISLLIMISVDYYWQCVGDHIICGNCPTAMQSKLDL